MIIAETTTGAEAAAFIGLIVAVVALIGAAMYVFLETRKAKLVAGQEDALRQLVGRYEKARREHPRCPTTSGR